MLAPMLCRAAPAIDMDNSVSQCVDVKLDSPVQKKGKLVTHAQISMNRELSECGCTSRQMAYHVVDAKGSLVTHGHFTLLGDTRRQLILGRKDRASAPASLKLWLGCAGA
ncbi:DUF2195 family protein [Caballeronia temeraria]|uniref:DUF2195 family protein n=1 Tax=Caballeronia temeraria TaxID=1777137 RepID=UPI0012FE2E6A|nr:DUF2195 family protein [Caballeronia temeraria]